MTQDMVERVTNGSYEPDDMSAIGDAARRIASYCEGEARLNVYRKAKLELKAIEATGVVELLKVAREALEFYADRDYDGYSVHVTDYGLSTDNGDIIKDGGERARQALTQLAKGNINE